MLSILDIFLLSHPLHMFESSVSAKMFAILHISNFNLGEIASYFELQHELKTKMKINFKKCTVISDNQINNAYSLLVPGGKHYEIPHLNLPFSTFLFLGQFFSGQHDCEKLSSVFELSECHRQWQWSLKVPVHVLLFCYKISTTGLDVNVQITQQAQQTVGLNNRLDNSFQKFSHAICSFFTHHQGT